MKRLFFAFLTVALLGGIVGISAWAADQEQCASVTHRCKDMCSRKLTDFRKAGGKYAKADLVNLMLDCIKICETREDFQRRDSASANEVGEVCSDICRRCAARCEELKDPTLKECIALCNQCASTCKGKHQ